jgi:hypothetical protein
LVQQIFLAASEEGGLVPISKCVPEDDGYHVAGALVVAPERAMQYAIAQLKRAIAECGDFPVFVITPWTRFVSQQCCMEVGHVTNFQDPDFLSDILQDLNKQKFYLRKSLAPATVLDGVQLVCGDNSSMERKEQTMRAGWAIAPSTLTATSTPRWRSTSSKKSRRHQMCPIPRQRAAESENGAPATGRKEIAVTTDAAAVPEAADPAVAAVADSVTMTVATVDPADPDPPVPDQVTTKPPSGAPAGNPEEKAATAAAKAAVTAAAAAATAAAAAATAATKGRSNKMNK